MSAACLTLSWSASPVLFPLCPICSTNFPAGVNLSSMSSELPGGGGVPKPLLPLIQMAPVPSAWIPCSRSGHS